ncbi:hypothetical protein AB3459_29345, partial [Pseudomonas aeruginosa]
KTWERASLTYGVDLDREKFTSDQMLFNLPLAAASNSPTPRPPPPTRCAVAMAAAPARGRACAIPIHKEN